MKRYLPGLLAAVGLAGCVTPSIPIPPPDPAEMTFDVVVPTDGSEGTARFTYPPDGNYVGSVVFIYNRDLGVGIIEATHADGSVGPTQPVAASLGNQIVISFDRDDQSVSTCIKLRQGAQSPYDYCE